MKKCLFTIHFGNYDAPHEPVVSDGWDYLMFTNRTDIKSDIWDIRTMVSPLPNYLAARYVFVNSNKFVKDYEYSLFIGGQIHVDGDLNEFFKQFDLTKDFNMMKHPCRTCIYAEAETILKENLDKSGNVPPHMKRYRDAGFPKNFGLNTSGIIGRWVNEKTAAFERMWWDEVLTGSYRDQLSFDYIRWKTGLTVHNFATPYWDLLKGDFFSIYKHGTNKRA